MAKKYGPGTHIQEYHIDSKRALQPEYVGALLQYEEDQQEALWLNMQEPQLNIHPT